MPQLSALMTNLLLNQANLSPGDRGTIRGFIDCPGYDELAARIILLQDATPDDWTSGPAAGFAVICKKNDAVWLCIPGVGATIIAGSVDPSPTLIHIVAGQYGTIATTTVLSDLMPGYYTLTVKAHNFNTSYWGSHGMTISAINPSDAAFAVPVPGDLALLTTAPDLVLALNNPASAPNPQVGSVTMYVSNTCSLQIYGSLPRGGDSFYLEIYTTPQ